MRTPKQGFHSGLRDLRMTRQVSDRLGDRRQTLPPRASVSPLGNMSLLLEKLPQTAFFFFFFSFVFCFDQQRTVSIECPSSLCQTSHFSYSCHPVGPPFIHSDIHSFSLSFNKCTPCRSLGVGDAVMNKVYRSLPFHPGGGDTTISEQIK